MAYCTLLHQNNIEGIRHMQTPVNYYQGQTMCSAIQGIQSVLKCKEHLVVSIHFSVLVALIYPLGFALKIELGIPWQPKLPIKYAPLILRAS